MIDADLSKYFDSIPHAKLLATVAERIVDGSVLALLAQWLKAPIIEDNGDSQRGVGGGKGNRRGTPQGGVISPLLSNLYLHLLDRLWRKHRLDIRLGARLVRYADDFVVLCARGVDEPLTLIRRFLERLDLTLNELRQRFSCSRVAIGLVEHASVHIAAFSDAATFEKNTPLVKTCRHAMEEAYDHGATIVQRRDSETRHAEHLHLHLLDCSGADEVLSCLLQQGPHCIGVLTLEQGGEQSFSAEQRL